MHDLRATIQQQIDTLTAERTQLIAAQDEIAQRIVFANGQIAALRAVLTNILELPDAPPHPPEPAAQPAARTPRGRRRPEPAPSDA